MKRNNNRPKIETLHATKEQMKHAIERAEIVVQSSAPWKGNKKMNEFKILEKYVTKTINVSALLFTGKFEEITRIEDWGLRWIKGNKDTGEFYFEDLDTGRKILVYMGQYVVFNKNGTITPYDPEVFESIYTKT